MGNPSQNHELDGAPPATTPPLLPQAQGDLPGCNGNPRARPPYKCVTKSQWHTAARCPPWPKIANDGPHVGLFAGAGFTAHNTTPPAAGAPQNNLEGVVPMAMPGAKQRFYPQRRRREAWNQTVTWWPASFGSRAAPSCSRRKQPGMSQASIDGRQDTFQLVLDRPFSRGGNRLCRHVRSERNTTAWNTGSLK